MKLSTRSRYGIRLMLELSLNYDKGLIFLKDISKNQEISEKYLGQIIIPLRSANLVASSRGAHGGYSLSRKPSAITLLDIINVLEGSSSVVECVNDPKICNRSSGKCMTRRIWSDLDKLIHDYLRGITLEDIIKKNKDPGGEMYQI